jgi:hypothetical protein
MVTFDSTNKQVGIGKLGSSGSSNTGAIVGGVIGGIVLIVIIVLVVRHFKNKKQNGGDTQRLMQN